MKKSNLKKALAIVLCLIMSISAMTLFVSADTATTPTFAKTVYMSSTGVDTNDGLTEATAVATLEKATKILGAEGGEIIVVNDMTVDLSAYEKLASGRRMFLEATNSTVYLHGKKQSNNSYPTLLFKTNGAAAIFELSGPFAIYDLGIGVAEEQNLWISANAYPLTIGNNVTTVMQGTKVANITGGRQDNGKSGVLRAADAECVVTIYSGVFGKIYGGSFAKDTVQTGGATINMFGGKADVVRGVRTGSKVTGEVVINFWGGEIAKAWDNTTEKGGIGSYTVEGVTNILNIYNNSMSDATKANLGGVYAADVTEGAGTVNNVTGTAPEFFTISAYDFAPPAPPTFEDDPDLGLNDDEDKKDETETKATETTAAPETTEAETEAEESGCGSVIGAGAIAIVAVTGAALVVGKKKEN